MKEVFKFFSKYYKNHKYNIILYELFAILHKGSIILIPIFTQKLIDTATNGNNLSEFMQYGFELCIIILFFITFLCSKYYLQNKIEISILNEIKFTILKKVNSISYNELINKDIGYFIQRINKDSDQIKSLIISDYTSLFINTVFVISIIIIMFKLNIILALILLVLLPTFIILSKTFLPKIAKTNETISQKGESINSYAEEMINGSFTLRTNNSAKYMLDKLKSILGEYYQAQIKETKYEMLFDFVLVTGIMNIATLANYFLGGYLVFMKVFSIGTLVEFTLYFSRLWDPIEFFMEFPKKLNISKVSLYRINELLSMQDDIDGPVTELYDFKSIEFKNVTFSYNNKTILDNINLKIKKGDKIGIIGSNGAGKSTFANLLVKIIKPSSGNILYNNTDYNSIDSYAIREKIILIPSDVYLFRVPIIENITLGHNDNYNNKIINQIGITQLFEGKGNDSNISIENKGQNLSGGEKKLIQIARGINRNGEVYILDEPLNYVDSQYKKIIIDFINNHFKDKTLIIISHDYEIFDDCNKIYSLENGKLIIRS